MKSNRNASNVKFVREVVGEHLPELKLKHSAVIDVMRNGSLAEKMFLPMSVLS